jgi:anhydro-N-acetylmuramic acid kinase
VVRYFTHSTEAYDAGGRYAAKGKVLERILEEALRHPFFTRRPPKSAGREQFGEDFVTAHFLGRAEGRFEDFVRTATEITARSIAGALDQFVFSSLTPGEQLHQLVVSGGGTHNKTLLERIKALLPALAVRRSDDYGMPVDAKEAIAFAVLADRTLHGLPGNLPSVTGASRAVVLGKVSRP